MNLQELGQVIREKREAAGVSIEDVAARIKISGRVLRGIEEGNLTSLPHAVYAKSFIRSFGQAVGYDAVELQVELEKIFPSAIIDASGEDLRDAPLPVLAASGRDGRLIAPFLLLFIGLLGGVCWYVGANYGEDILRYVKQPFSAVRPVQQADMEIENSTPDLSASTIPALSEALPDADGPRAADSRASFSGSSALALPVTLENIVDIVPEETASPIAGGSDEAPASPTAAVPETHQLRITAHRACWLGPNVDGEQVRSFTLQPGQTHVFTYKKGMTLVLGNPSGITLEHDGKDMGVPYPGSDRVLRLSFPPAR